MAYGNWGGRVYRNGEEMREWEDATPYRETTEAPGYHQAFKLSVKDGEAVRDDTLRPQHAVLGQGRVRLCGYKNSPVLYLDGESVDLDPFVTERGEYGAEVAGRGEVEGHAFGWERSDDPAKVDLHLTEPDGTNWSGFSGYCMGAGHDDW